MDERKAKQQVIRAGKELCRSGLIARTWGNVSCLLDGKAFVITASGRDYLTLTEEEIVRVDMEDLSYEGRVKPSSELKIHRAVYRMKKDASFVIHTHQDWASAVSAMGLGQISFGESYPLIGGTVVCADYGLPGSDQLCENVEKALECSEGKAVILKNHGALCYGKDYDEAFRVAYTLEDACGIYLRERDPRIRGGKKGDETIISPTMIWNRSSVLLDFAENEDVMMPYLDDFAQIAGMRIEVFLRDKGIMDTAVKQRQSIIVRGVGAFCTAEVMKDIQALSKIIEKNAMAYLAAQITGANCLEEEDCHIMRQKYLQTYSKLMDVNS